MAFWKCYYHVVWATKNRSFMLEERYEPVAFEAIRSKSEALSCEVIAVNGMPDHVHVAVSIPPTLTVTDWVKNVKGVSSREVNNVLAEQAAHFRWQTGYGVLTFGTRNLDFVVSYIQNQKQHHANNDLYQLLETTGD